jgi:LuxR family transcriptional regulator, quorum-sensing system regulator CviR
MSQHESTQALSSLSGNDAITLLEIIHGSLACNREADFTGLFPKIRELFPFDFAGALLGSLDNNGVTITHGANISFPEEWLREYLSNNYFLADVATKETFHTGKLKHWSYLANDYSVIVPKEIKALNMDFGVKEAYFHGGNPLAPEKNRSVFCFACPSMKPDSRTAAILEILVPHLHLALSHIFIHTLSNIHNTVLSNREKEVLNWLKQGKSSWDMSVILGISESTVNFHIYNIMRKLNATNRPQAVAVAVHLGLIDVD